MKNIDLNADMGESFGPWKMGNDGALLQVITSANVACGFHAGDPDVMQQTMQQAQDCGVGIGAHPGFDDLQGFGRRRLHLSKTTLQNQIRYQIGAAQAMARSVGAEIRHIKLHGALSNMASEHAELAYDAYEAALSVAPETILMVLAASAQEEVAQSLPCRYVGEIFADRAYNEDATLVDRSIEGAVIHDPGQVAIRILAMLQEAAIIAEDGTCIPTQIDTICLHGDTPQAVEIARNLRSCLEAEKIQIGQF